MNLDSVSLSFFPDEHESVGSYSAVAGDGGRRFLKDDSVKGGIFLYLLKNFVQLPNRTSCIGEKQEACVNLLGVMKELFHVFSVYPLCAADLNVPEL